MRACMPFFRPGTSTLVRQLPPGPGIVYAHFFHSLNISNTIESEPNSNFWTRNSEVKERLEGLDRPMELYPRIVSKNRDMTFSAFNQEFRALKYIEQPNDVGEISLQGMFSTLRRIV